MVELIFRIKRGIATVRHWISNIDGTVAILYRWIILQKSKESGLGDGFGNTSHR